MRREVFKSGRISKVTGNAVQIPKDKAYDLFLRGSYFCFQFTYVDQAFGRIKQSIYENLLFV